MDCQLKDGGKHGPTDIHPLCETYPTGTKPYFLCILCQEQTVSSTSSKSLIIYPPIRFVFD